MPDLTPEIVRLQPHQQGEAAETLAAAFRADPLLVFLLPDETRRPASARLIHRSSLRYGLLYGEVHVTPDLTGVAIWLVPGRTTVTLWRMMRAGALGLRRELGAEAYARLVSYLAQTSRMADEQVPGLHWHLLQLGVAPALQGQGLGGALVQPVLHRADADGLPCYLDTFNEKALAFYQKHRFRVVTEARVPNGGPRFWAMLRKPRQ